MDLKRILSVILAVLVFASLCACAPKTPEDDPKPTAGPTAEATAEPTGTPPAPTEAPPETPPVTPEITDEPETPFVFRPKVCSVYMREIFGDTMCEAWSDLVDAVMAGEDSFPCPDKHTYNWVMGQFRSRCFPILTELIDYAYDRNEPVKDGVGSFTWLVPPEEAAVRIEEFAEQVEGILNETMKSSYSDLEKAASLYEYFSRTYEYDYDTADKMEQTYVDYITAYRLFKTGTGICSEISPAYSYLLMQAGVEATTVMCGNHEWSYVRINGVNYHIDPTFVLADPCSLSYFMMTDEQRDASGFIKAMYIYTSNYAQDHPHPDYAADDDTFSPLWDRYFAELLPGENVLRSWVYTEGWEKEYADFDYTGY